MTNDDVLFLAQALGAVDAPDMEPDFNYAVAHNLREAEKISETIRDAVKPGDDFKKFEDEMQELRLKYTRNDSEGNPIMNERDAGGGRTTSTYDIPGLNNPNSPFNLAVKKCKEEFKTEIDKQEKKLEFLKNNNTKADIMMIDKEDWPTGLSRVAADGIFLMTNPPAKKKEKPAKKKETEK